MMAEGGGKVGDNMYWNNQDMAETEFKNSTQEITNLLSPNQTNKSIKVLVMIHIQIYHMVCMV